MESGEKKCRWGLQLFRLPHLSLLLVSDSLSLEYDSTTDQIEQNPVKSKAHFPSSTAAFILLSNLNCSSLHFIFVCGGNFNSLGLFDLFFIWTTFRFPRNIQNSEAATPPHSRLLGLAPGTPVMVIERLARGYDGTPLEWRRSRGRADRFRYQVEIR